MQTGHKFHHSTISFIPFITSMPNLHPHSTHTPSYETALFQRALTHVTSFIHFLFNQKYTSFLHYLMLCVLENELFFLFSLHSVLSAFNWRLNYFFAFIFSLSLSLSFSLQAICPNLSGTFFIGASDKLHYEVTASSLVHVDRLGKAINEERSSGTVNESGAWLHSVVYRCRPDVGCVFHLQNSEAMAVSCSCPVCGVFLSDSWCLLLQYE